MSTKIYVGRLPPSLGQSDIEDLFGKYGNIKTVELKDGGYGFVTFDQESEADEAVASLNDFIIDGVKILVEKTVKQAPPPAMDYGGDYSNGAIGGPVCYVCNNPGHIAKFCPDNQKTCHRCGQPGHFARECTEPDIRDRNGPPRDTRDTQCYNCQEYGHMARDCQNARVERQRPGGRNCFNCGRDGHLARDCPDPRNERGGSRGARGVECYKCGELGHFARDCRGRSRRDRSRSRSPRRRSYTPSRSRSRSRTPPRRRERSYSRSRSPRNRR